MVDEFATVLKSWSVEEAHLARIRLADAGIECQLADAQTVAMDWGLANAIRGVSVVVKQSDAERARQILDEAPFEEADDFPQDSDDQRDDDNDRSGTSDDDVDRTSGAERDGTLGSMRSIARPIIVIMIGTALVYALVIIGSLLLFTFR